MQRTTADLNAATLAAGITTRRTLPRLINRARAGLESSTGTARATRGGTGGARIAVTGGFGFEGPSLADSLSFPPDTMGAVGPTQFIAALNGRFRSYSKTTGVADGALNVDPDVFFASVLSPVVRHVHDGSADPLRPPVAALDRRDDRRGQQRRRRAGC